jgi:nucleotide-binding universal stress UspA family protein
LERLRPHFLFCYDGRSASRRALSYLKQVFKGMPFDLTIVHIILYPGNLFSLEADFLKELEKEKRAEREMKRLFSTAQKELNSLAEEIKEQLKINVFTKVAFKNRGVPEDLIQIAEEGLFDAIVVGRRGLTKLSSYILGGVTYKLLNSSPVPVWFIRGNQWNQKFLVCFDITEKDLALFDYVSFLLRDHPSAKISFFHTFSPLKDFFQGFSFEGSLKELLSMLKKGPFFDYFLKVKKIFKENDFPLDRAIFRLKRSVFGVIGEIVRLAKRENYSTIIIGHCDKKGWEKLFSGSICEKLLTYFEDRAIWVIS